MAVSIKYLDHGLGFLMLAEGVVTGQEILDAVDERFSSEERTREYLYGISDYTDITKITMEASEVKRVAEKDMHVSKINPDLVMAIAAPKDLMYGLCRMFEAHAQETGWDIAVFRSLEEAQRWVLEKLGERPDTTASITFEECE